MGKPVKISLKADSKFKKEFDLLVKQFFRVKKLSASIGKFMKKAFGFIFNIKSLLGGVGIVGVLAKSVQISTRFAKSMALVNTMLDRADIEGFTKQIRVMSVELGIAKDALAEGLYQTLSASVPPQNAITFLETSARAAVAGATDVAVAVDGMSTVINAWGLDSADAAEIADVMFQTVKRGKTTFEELASAIGAVGPLAAASGVSFEEVSGAIATLSKQGASTSEAVTRITASILAATEVLGDGAFEARNIAEAFAEMSRQAGGSNKKLRELVGRKEALLGVLALTGKNFRTATDDINAMSGAGGSLDVAFKKMAKVQGWVRLWQGVNSVITRVGDVMNSVLLPAVDRLATLIGTFVEGEGFGKTLDQWKEKFQGLVDVMEDVIKILKFGTDADRKKVFEAGRNLFKDLFSSAMRTAVGIFLKAAPLIGNAIGSAAKDVMTGVFLKAEERARAVKELTAERGETKTQRFGRAIGSVALQRFGGKFTGGDVDVRQRQIEQQRLIDQGMSQQAAFLRTFGGVGEKLEAFGLTINKIADDIAKPKLPVGEFVVGAAAGAAGLPGGAGGAGGVAGLVSGAVGGGLTFNQASLADIFSRSFQDVIGGGPKVPTGGKGDPFSVTIVDVEGISDDGGNI